MAYQPIKSSKQAESEARKIHTIVAGDTWLATKVLIYQTELLEKLLAAHKPKRRKPSAWQEFMGQQMSKGRTVKEAAALWQNRNSPKQ